MQAEKAQRVAEEAQREAARQARAERAEALREKLQRKRMSKIMDGWSLYSLRARINRVRIHVTLSWVQQDVEVIIDDPPPLPCKEAFLIPILLPQCVSM